MTIYSALYISGIEQEQIFNYSVNKSISDNNSAGEFTATIDNFQGVNADDFNLGGEVNIYAYSTDDIIGSTVGSMLNNSSIVSGLYMYFKCESGITLNDVVRNQRLYFSGGYGFNTGIIGSSLELNGTTGYAGAPVTGSNDLIMHNFSYNIWLKTTDTDAGLIAKWRTSPPQISWYLQNGSIRCYVFTSTPSYNNVTINVAGSTASYNIFNNNWNMLTLTRQDPGSIWSQYFNGSLIFSGVDAAYYESGLTTDWVIGRDPGGRYLAGNIDDIRIYDYALSAGSIINIYNSGAPVENYTFKRVGTKIFTGILEDIQYRGANMDEKIELSGRDYSARLMDRTVQPEVYTNYEIGSIVRDIITKYTDGISTTSVSGTGIILDRVVFNHKPVYDAINQLAKSCDYVFYVDENKVLHFEPKSSSSSGYTLGSDNVIRADFKEQRDTVFNQIWVYGDRYLDGFKETFTAGSPLGGSIFTLLYNPHNTEVTVSGAVIQPGAIEGITVSPSSGTKYLVNYHDKKIIFTSGTNLGANIPASGNQVIVNYKRSLPIVKVGDDESSKTAYGTRVKVIIDKDIKDPIIAENLMKKELIDNADPKKQGDLDVQGLYNITPGQTITINLPFHNINSQIYDVIETNYEFNKETNLTEEIMRVKVNKKINDVTDTLKDIILDLKKIQAGDIADTDLITRFQTATGSLSVRQSGLTIYTRTLGSSWILGKGYHGVAGATFGGILGSVTASGINFLGDSRTSLSIIWSGGYF